MASSIWAGGSTPKNKRRRYKTQNQMFMDYIAYALLMATSCCLLWFFGCIWVAGSHYIQEPNIIILSGETVGIAAILGFATYNLIRLTGK